MNGIEHLSDAEIRVLKELSEKTRFIFENLVESYLAMSKPHVDWTEEIKIAHFIKWCQCAGDWGMRLLPSQPQEIATFLQNVQNLEKEQFLTQRELYFRNIDAHNQSRIEVLKAVFEFANITIKSLILANGGSIVALLTLMGTIWKDEREMVIANMLPSLWWFCIGLICAVFVSLFAYLTQYCYCYEKEKIGKFFHIFAVASAFFSVGFFIAGTVSTLSSFQ